MLSVLRIGGVGDQVDILRDALLSRFSSSHEDDGKRIITIANRYFTAKLCIENLDLTPTEPTSSSTDSTSSNNMEKKEEGIILVFDANTGQKTFDSLVKLHGMAEATGQCGDLLRLCVGATASATKPNGKEYEEEYSRRVLWCLDRDYEYVEADLSTEGMMKGHDVRDKEGFARVVEAVGQTVWSSAVMHSKKKLELKESYQAVKGAQQAQSKDSQSSETAQEKSSEYAPPSLPLPQIVPASQSDDVSKDKEEEKSERIRNENRKKEEENETIFDDLDMCMREAAQIRKEAKLGTMTDKERRQKAGDTALKLMGLLDSLDFDDDGGADSNDDD